MLAIFGTVLVVFTPNIGGPGWFGTGWVIFVVVALKVPLLAILWWLIVQHHEHPHLPPMWLPAEEAAILAHLDSEARRVEHLDNAVAQLDYLSTEAWHVADRVGGEAKVDALTTALRIDLIRERAHRQRSGRGGVADDGDHH